MTQVVSSLSGIQFYAPSAGYAPTNSGDVSAIASAYQVVSSTGTQLYAGTDYVTAVNGDPLSASRAGNAANASLASSAWYDGTGRLISSLPDGAEVSSIASSYAGSAASSKLDTSAFSSVSGTFLTSVDLTPYQEKTGMSAYVLSGDVSGVIDTVSANSASWAESGVDSATVSAIASAYTESGMSSKQDTLAFAYDTVNAISSINGSALAGGGGGGGYVEKSAREVTIGTGNTATSTSLAFGDWCSASGLSEAFGLMCSATMTSMAHGSACRASSNALAQGLRCSATGYALSQGGLNWAYNNSFAQGYRVSANSYSFGQGYNISAAWTGAAIGVGLTAKNTAFAVGTYNLKQNGSTASTGESAAFVIGDGTASGARHDLMVVTKDGEITMYSSTADTAGTGIMSAIRAISAAATGGGVDSATVSAIASSYVDSGVSGKLDSSASSSFYTTANESGFITGVDLSPYQTTADMSGYIPTSMSSDFQQVTGMSSYALSSDVSGTVDLVSTQSANWGGSALQMSAGPGVKLEKSGNVLIASTDETVLWSQTAYSYGMSSVTLSESYKNFEVVKVYTNKGDVVYIYPDNSQLVNTCSITHFNGANIWSIPWTFTDDTHFDGAAGVMLYNDSGTMKSITVDASAPYGRWAQPQKIVGINRTAEA